MSETETVDLRCQCQCQCQHPWHSPQILSLIDSFMAGYLVNRSLLDAPTLSEAALTGVGIALWDARYWSCQDIALRPDMGFDLVS